MTPSSRSFRTPSSPWSGGIFLRSIRSQKQAGSQEYHHQASCLQSVALQPIQHRGHSETRYHHTHGSARLNRSCHRHWPIPRTTAGRNGISGQVTLGQPRASSGPAGLSVPIQALPGMFIAPQGLFPRGRINLSSIDIAIVISSTREDPRTSRSHSREGLPSVP